MLNKTTLSIFPAETTPNMTPNPKTLVLSVLTFFVIGTIPAIAQKNLQPGYIVTLDHDTLRGRIDFKEWTQSPRQVLFLSGTQTTSTYSPEDISSFFVAGETYGAFTVRIHPFSLDPVEVLNGLVIDTSYDKKVFMRLLTGGHIDLFQYEDTLGTTYFFTRKGNETPEQLRVINSVAKDGGSVVNNYLFRAQLTRQLDDCPAVIGKIARTSYQGSDLQKLIFKYNFCGQDTTQRTPNTDRIKLRITPQFGFVRTQLHFNGSDQPLARQHFPAYNNVAGGAAFLFVMPRHQQRFSFGLDLLYKHVQTSSDSIPLGDLVNTHSVVDYNQLQMSLIFRYMAANSQRYRPFAEVGIGDDMVIGNKSQKIDYNASSHATTNSELLSGNFKKHQKAFFAGLGINRDQLSFSARFEYSEGMSPLLGLASPVNSLYFLVGWTF